MPSFLHRFSSLSCRNANAVIGNMDCRHGAASAVVHDEKEMLEAFSGYSNRYDASPSPEHTTVTKEEVDEDTFHPIMTEDPTAISKPEQQHEEIDMNIKRNDNNSRRSMRSYSMRSMSRRSTLSRMDSCNTNISNVSIRSSPWKHISTNILFWNDKNHQNESVENAASNNSAATTNKEDIPVTEHDETSTNNGDDETYDKEYIFHDTSDDESNIEPIAVLQQPKTMPMDDTSIINCSSMESLADTKSEETSSYQLASLLGTTIAAAISEVDTTQIQQESAFIGIYYAKAQHCIQTTEFIQLFTSGYYYNIDGSTDNTNNNDVQGLSIVFVDADDDSNDVPSNMPSYWYTLSSCNNSNEQKQHIRQQLNIVDTICGPTLIILEPSTGTILCSNAIPDIVALNRTDSTLYDREACQLYDTWIQNWNIVMSRNSSTGKTATMKYEQIMHVQQNDNRDHEIIVEYMDGEQNEYELCLPFCI